MGYSANLQKYVINMIKSSSPTTFTFNRADENTQQAFPLGVSFQYVLVDEIDVAVEQGET